MNTATDTRTAYLYARILLGVSVALSLACNSAHAYLNAERVPVQLAMGVGAIPPLILALSVEAVVFCSRHARWAWGWAAVTFAAGVGLVTGFSMSFAAIRELGLMARMSVWTAPMLPIGIDALVITGLGMVALFRPRHEEAMHQEMVTTAVVAAPAAPAQQLAAPLLAAPVEHLITTEDEVITAPIRSAQFGDQEPVTSADAAGDHRREHAAHQDGQVIPLVSKAGHQDQVTSEQVGGVEQLRTAQPESAGVTTAQLLTPGTADEQSAGEQQIDPERDAQVLKERGARLSEHQLTDLIARIAAGENYSAISEATGISRNTVRKVAGQVPTEPEPVPVA